MTVNVLGISAYYHDSAAALVSDGKIMAAAQEERFSRRKHDARFPFHAIQYCLQHNGIGGRDLDFIVFYEKPLVTFERLLETYVAFAPGGFRSFIAAMPVWLKNKLFLKHSLKKDLAEILDVSRKKLPPLLFTEHHQAHAASAFFSSPFEKAAVLSLDGVGEWATSSVWLGERNRLTPKWEIDFPHSLGLLYSAFTYYTGFKVNSGEYKLMGLAPYGEPKYVRRILDNLIDVKDDGTFRLDMSFFDYANGLTMTSPRFDELFGGAARQPESEITAKDMDMARSIQFVTEEIVLRLCKTIHEELKATHLCLAGGVALNCVANRRIIDEGLFEDVWVQPASGDAGGALGAALAVYYQYLEKPRTVDGLDAMQGSLLGPDYSDTEIIQYLKWIDVPYIQLDESALLDQVAEKIEEQKVVGWFQGRMEFGPRALGSRSILADPRDPRMQSVLNLRIKKRESFRPFAPAVKWKKASDWFEVNGPSLYMTSVSDVKENKRIPLTAEQQSLSGFERLSVVRSRIPAVTHVDNSARVQTVHHDTNPLFYRLLDVFEKRTGCPVLVNTSFNVRGEPIVCSPEDAYQCFMRTEMDYLALGNVLLAKADQPDRHTSIHGQNDMSAGPAILKENEPVEKSTLRQFGLVTGAITAVLFGLFLPLTGGRPLPAWPWIVMMVLWLWAFLLPKTLQTVYKTWLAMGSGLGWLNNRTILSIMYFAVICPVGMVFRLLGKDSMARKFQKDSNTYRVHSTVRSKTHFQRPY